ncbi:hypothetical protein BM613_14155 [Sulfoacidibacillus thermotolerans]|uniref:Photosynthesis system II assembly factor Ycf48/Hcf136-like domain-containing protein n=1 Tax=Sulfoacidibacillus thermotolerans TaxID=1765684 RepID=A0A2U3CT55_SULT2|nr:hypothetical protein BM613_14155 [Sulfoacidibacillus thermotolerans]
MFVFLAGLLSIATFLTGCDAERVNQPIHPITSTKMNTTKKQGVSNINFSQVKLFNQHCGWAFTQKGDILRLERNTSTWFDVTPKELDPYEKQFSSVFFLNRSDAWIAVHENSISGLPLILYYTTDGGKRWTAQPFTQLLKYPSGNVYLKFLNSKIGYLININPGMGTFKAALYKTENGGVVWRFINQTNTTTLSKGIQPLPHVTESLPFGANPLFTTSNIGWLFGKARADYLLPNQTWLYLTNNGGQTWTHINLLPKPVSSHVAVEINWAESIDQSVLFIQTLRHIPTLDLISNTLYEKKNQGQTWHSLLLPSDSILYASFVSPTKGWILLNNGVLDQITAQQIITRTHIPHVQDVLGMHFLTSKTGYLVYAQIIKWTNTGGTTWTQLST